jgi:hypothetical protein
MGDVKELGDFSAALSLPVLGKKQMRLISSVFRRGVFYAGPIGMCRLINPELKDGASDR